MRPRPCARPTVTVVLPSPSGVGVIAVTSMYLPSGRSCRRSKTPGSTFALYLPYISRSSGPRPVRAATSRIGSIGASWAISRSLGTGYFGCVVGHRVATAHRVLSLEVGPRRLRLPAAPAGAEGRLYPRAPATKRPRHRWESGTGPPGTRPMGPRPEIPMRPFLALAALLALARRPGRPRRRPRDHRGRRRRGDRHGARRPRGPRPSRRGTQNPVRLKDHRVEGTIQGRVADVTVEQVFHNDSGRQLEGTYLFPLPEGASVAKFAMTMGGKMVEGEIMEAAEARRIYTDIVRRRRDPGLLEYLGRGLFRARVFPIEPHQDLTIRLSFQQILPENDGTLEFRYPLATDRLHGQPVENALVSLKVESDVDIKAIYSPSHDVAVVRDGNRKAHVSYERAGQRQEHDFLLYVGRSPEDVGFSLPEPQGRRRGRHVPGRVRAVERRARRPPDAEGRRLRARHERLDGRGRQDRPGPEGARVRRARPQPGRPLQHRGLLRRRAPVPRGPRGGDRRDQGRGLEVDRGPAGAGRHQHRGRARPRRSKMATDRLFMVVFITDGRPTIGTRDPDALVEPRQAAEHVGRARLHLRRGLRPGRAAARPDRRRDARHARLRDAATRTSSS